jgi:hypothetical protein
MFNKALFNKTLFNRILPLFRDKETISLIGERIGFDVLEGLFQPSLGLYGIENLTIEQFGNFGYEQDLDGNYKIYYDLDGQLITVLKDVKAERVIELLGRLDAAVESGEELSKELLGELLEVNKDGEN